MKILLLNDTSHYHFGCEQVMNVLKKYYNPTNICKTPQILSRKDIANSDLVVLNGEGILHDDQAVAKKFLDYIKIAQELKKQTHIINAVWQKMDKSWLPLLKKCDLLEVRECLSQKEIICNSNVVLDASIHSEVKKSIDPRCGVCVGGSFYGEINIDWPHQKINIFKQKWDELVKILQKSELLITGRHHEMYAALQARTPVMVISGNTWKNEGFFYTVEAKNLLLKPSKENIADVLNGKYKSDWDNIWRYLDKYDYKFLNKTYRR